MRLSRTRTLFYPVLGILAAALVLLITVTVSTYYNLEKAGKGARRVLDAQSTAIVSGLAAGLRTGWRHWVWQADSLQGLVQEMSQFGDVGFIILLGQKGLVLAHSNPDLVGKVWNQDIDLLDRLETDQVNGWFTTEGDLYLAGRKLAKGEIGPGMSPGSQRWGMMHDRRWPLELPRPEIILVGLNTKSYREIQAQQLHHALIMAGLLFVIGSAAIYFIFLLQNYRTIDRTLTDLNTYTASIVNNMPNGLITLDVLGEPVMINQAARHLFGWSDQPERALSRAAVIQALSREFNPLLKRGEKILEKEFEAQLDPNTILPLAVSASQVPAEGGPGSVFILRDLRQIRALEDQVRQNEKLAALGRLAAGIAHEVRNPLSSMRGLARFLARDLDEKSREAEYLKVMVEEIDRLNRVVTGLLDFARPRPADLKPIDFNEIARHTSHLVADDAKARKVSIREDMAPEKPVILVDRDQAIQAMLNVLLNALEAMPQGGRVTINTKTADGFGLYMVEDSGPGFPAKDRSKLIDPFYTTKEKGTGLGLAQVASIMTAHGGRLELGGEPGMGARVVLYFPLVKGQAAVTPSGRAEDGLGKSEMT